MVSSSRKMRPLNTACSTPLPRNCCPPWNNGVREVCGWVHPDDLGKVIGRGGRTASAFRTVVSALAGKGGARVDLVLESLPDGALYGLGVATPLAMPPLPMVPLN